MMSCLLVNSDHENTEQSVHQSESSPIPMSSLPMENERKHINGKCIERSEDFVLLHEMIRIQHDSFLAPH